LSLAEFPENPACRRAGTRVFPTKTHIVGQGPRPELGRRLVPCQIFNKIIHMENKNKLPQRKQIRLTGFDYSTPTAYFITICANKKQNLFVRDNLNRKIMECIHTEKLRTNFKIYVYCLMPNHIHLLLNPAESGITVSQFIGGFKSKSTYIAWEIGIAGKIWQPRFHDYILRKTDDLKIVGQYILDNPVRKNLVTKWDNYKYSGFIDSWL
jgi:putative transposase